MQLLVQVPVTVLVLRLQVPLVALQVHHLQIAQALLRLVHLAAVLVPLHLLHQAALLLTPLVPLLLNRRVETQVSHQVMLLLPVLVNLHQEASTQVAPLVTALL